MSRRTGAPDDVAMDTLSLLILAVGSLAFLDLAAMNLRGDERTHRRGRVSRVRC
jgi:hypothetical protein